MFHFNKTKDLIKIENKNFIFECDESLIIHTDRGDFNIYDPKYSNGDLCQLPFSIITINNIVNSNNNFYEKKIEIKFLLKTVLLSVEKKYKCKNTPLKVIHYNTFRNASTTAFIRFDGFGLFSGFANPYFTTTKINDFIIQQYDTSLLFNENDIFTLDNDFLGIYSLSKDKYYECLPETPLKDSMGYSMTRYHNPCGSIPLYKSEIFAFQKYSNYYLNPNINKFIVEMYCYFCPLPPQPNTRDQEELYYKAIDVLTEIGGDYIVFNPLQRQKIPTSDINSYWEVYEENSIAQRIVNYAKEKKLKYGIYMGTAQANVNYSNSTMNSYVSNWEKPIWKKHSISGGISDENCIASDDFRKWYISVQKNTINKYNIDLWNWDPGPGNGHYCYANNHGHIPGKGSYKGFRGALEVLKEIKNMNSDMYLQAFHGTKEYGLWGLKYFSQHEAYWEQDPGFFATIYPDYSADRITANGMRMQAMWNMMFRFLPASINHSLASRMTQNCESDSSYLELFDYIGYEYAFMSALACGASITFPNLPLFENHLIKKAKSFYSKWIKWAKENFDYLKYCYPIGSIPKLGSIDGYARIIEDKGFIFLCNLSPMKTLITFTLDECIGFFGEDIYGINVIYPYNYRMITEEGLCVFKKNDKISINIDENTILILQIVQKPNDVEIFGIEGSFEIKNEIVYISTKKQKEGTKARVWITNVQKIKQVYINNEEIIFQSQNNSIYADIIFGCEIKTYSFIWKEKNNELISNAFINKKILDSVILNNSISLSNNVLKYANSTNMYFAWSQPNKVYFVLPLIDTSYFENPEIIINKKSLKLLPVQHWGINMMTTSCYIVDVTNILLYNEYNEIKITNIKNYNNFLPGYLSYINMFTTNEINNYESTSTVLSNTINNDFSFHMNNEGLKITILNAWLSKNIISSFDVVKLKVVLNICSSEVKRVFCDCPIIIDSYSKMTMNTDRLLTYNEEESLWEVTFIIGDRRLLIIDEPEIHIYAVSINNNISDEYILPIIWKV